MGHFPPSEGYTHILVVVDYVTKWVEAIPTKSVDGETLLKMLKHVIFPRFGVPRYLMTDGGSHFIHGGFRKTLWWRGQGWAHATLWCGRLPSLLLLPFGHRIRDRKIGTSSYVSSNSENISFGKYLE
jgi:hypothetical protein